ncbi:MAG: cysteine desulfurase family protein [Acidobacteriota bacterium]
MSIYLDFNATAPLAPEALSATIAALQEVPGNASSVHAYGQRAKAMLDDARASVASLLNGEQGEIVFTSGGTEADNLAIRGVAESREREGRRHLIVSSIEHEAVLRTVQAFGRRGWRISLLPVGTSGVIDPARLTAVIDGETAIVSVMHVNNEIGTLQPVADLARVAHEHGAYFHTDAVQSVGRMRVDVREVGADLLSCSGHKFGGPKGAGVLWVRRGLHLAAQLTGGRQERNRRAGTENVPAIAGLGAAAAAARRDAGAREARVGALRDRLERGILERVPRCNVNGDPARRAPNTTNISFDGVDGESLLIALDLEGIAVSTGSACSSGSLDPSHVLKAMGLPPSRVQSAIRFSLGPTTTEEEINRVVDVLPATVSRLRSLASRR